MGCATGQTSAILDCICVNGKPLIEYIDGGDQALQELITVINNKITALQACCTSNSQAIATWQGLITTIQGEITALQTCCTSNTAAITTIQGIITTLQGQITALQNAITALQAQAHPRLTLTKQQDVTNRAALDVTNQMGLHHNGELHPCHWHRDQWRCFWALYGADQCAGRSGGCNHSRAASASGRSAAAEWL
jgi:hypothetical protein